MPKQKVRLLPKLQGKVYITPEIRERRRLREMIRSCRRWPEGKPTWLRRLAGIKDYSSSYNRIKHWNPKYNKYVKKGRSAWIVKRPKPRLRAKSTDQ